MIRKTYRIDKKGQLIKGVLYHAFIENGSYFLTDIGVYEDGMIDCWEWVDLEGFKEKVRTGWVRKEVPEGAEFSIFRIGTATMQPGYGSSITDQDFIDEIEDTIDQLQGRPSRGEICRQVFEQFLRDRTEANRAQLEEAYHRIPPQLRIITLGDMDRKDWPIKTAIEKGVHLAEMDAQELLQRYFPSEEDIARQKKRFEDRVRNRNSESGDDK